MKSGTKPTRAQMKILDREKLDTFDYLVIKMMGPNGYLFQHRGTQRCVVVYNDQKGVYGTDGTTLLKKQLLERENLNDSRYSVLKIEDPDKFFFKDKETQKQVVIYVGRQGVYDQDGETLLS